MMDIAIIVVGYNRPDCMSRLLSSLNCAVYDQDVPLIISLDNSGTDSVERIANEFVWKHGEKRVVTHEKRLGLKAHVLECGNRTSEFEHVVVFEDDLYVSPHFFSFVEQAVDKYDSNDDIAGIGLYSYSLNQNNGYAFEPIDDGNDVYFMQYACSWGQVWSRKKWNAFMAWYSVNSQPYNDNPVVPPNVNRWDARSWLKYHVRYCAENKKFFVYPRVSLTTNYSSAGSHNAGENNSFQVPFVNKNRKWRMPDFIESSSKYDSYYENLSLADVLLINDDDICIDTYGVHKTNEGRKYWLTTKVLDYKIVKTFGFDFRPREANIIYGTNGDFFKLYNTSIKEDNRNCSQRKILREEIKYIVKSMSLKQMINYCISETLARIKNKARHKK